MNEGKITRIEPFPITPKEDTKALMSFIYARLQGRIYENEWEFFMRELSRPGFVAEGAKQRWREKHGEIPEFAFKD